MPQVARPNTIQRRHSTLQPTTLRAHVDELQAEAGRLIVEGTRMSQVVLHRLLDELPFAALVTNDVGVLVFANSAASDLTGYTNADLRGMSFLQLTPGVREREADVLWRAFVDRGEQSGEYEVLASGGRTIATVYAARANFLPGLHLSLLAVPSQ
jgi:PAS domain S-box-containing protein